MLIVMEIKPREEIMYSFLMYQMTVHRMLASVTSSVKRLSFSMYYDEANSNPHDMDVFFEDVPTLAQLMQLEEPVSLNLLKCPLSFSKFASKSSSLLNFKKILKVGKSRSNLVGP